MHDGPVRPSGSEPLVPIPTLPEPVSPLTSSGPSVGRFVLWQVAMMLVWGNLFFHEWHSPWLPAWIVGFVPFENLVGKAQIIFFSMDEESSFLEFWHWPTSVRWQRIFQVVH